MISVLIEKLHPQAPSCERLFHDLVKQACSVPKGSWRRPEVPRYIRTVRRRKNGKFNNFFQAERNRSSRWWSRTLWLCASSFCFAQLWMCWRQSEFWEENAAFRNLHVLVVADGDPAVQAASAVSVCIFQTTWTLQVGYIMFHVHKSKRRDSESQHLVLTGHFDSFCLQHFAELLHGLRKGVAWRMDIQTHLMCRWEKDQGDDIGWWQITVSCHFLCLRTTRFKTHVPNKMILDLLNPFDNPY